MSLYPWYTKSHLEDEIRAALDAADPARFIPYIDPIELAELTGDHEAIEQPRKAAA
jgi:hypothetical protein